MKRRIEFPCTIMRGGTSKGIFLREEVLPEDPLLRERIILAVFGSPDLRQIDGLGGADSLTSKLAIIAPGKGGDRDVNYTFGAVGIETAFVDYSANCGNISSAVGPYAVEEGLVKAVEPYTEVRIFNTNTKRMIRARVPVKKGRFYPEGDYAIDGCPGTGSRIDLTFVDPGGVATGRTLPTGNVSDELVLVDGKRYEATIIDAGNPTAFVSAADLGLKGDETPRELDGDPEIIGKLEEIRRAVAGKMGIPLARSIPKVSWVAPPRAFKTSDGRIFDSGEVSFLARVLAMGKIHKAYALTAAIPAAIGAVLPGSVVRRAAGHGIDRDAERIVIGHPAGTIEVKVELRGDTRLEVKGCTIGRTARRIMDGRVYISEKIYEGAD